MTRFAWACALVCAAAPAAALDFASVDAYENHNAFLDARQAPVLRLLVGSHLSLAPESARPLASLQRLYDANPGNLEAVPASFLEFAAPRAVLALRIAAWREVRTVALTALEDANAAGTLSLRHVARGGAATAIATSRRVVERRGDAMLVEYAAAPAAALAAGTLRIDYRAPGQQPARLGELIVDDIGRDRGGKRSAPIRTIDDWMREDGAAVCPRVRVAAGKVAAGAPSRELLTVLLPKVNAGYETRLAEWKTVRDPQRRLVTHAFVLKVDDTGHPLIDYVRAWLVVPIAARRGLPLVILPHQGHLYAAQEPMGVQGETELALAGELALQGVASLAYDAAPFGTPRGAFVSDYLTYYPASGSTAKDLDNLARLLDRVLDKRLQALAGVKLDPKRIGIWGFSYGSWVSMLYGAMDDRISAIGFSSFHYRDADIVPGLTASLYIPQLACVADPARPPISVRRILREYGRDAFVVAPDIGLLEDWVRGLDDARVTVVANPFGHVVSMQERAAVLGFFYRSFGVRAKPALDGPAHVLATKRSEIAPYVERENLWRTELVKARTP